MVLVGATTENPYFEVNSALISRTQVYELHELTPEDIAGLLRRALDEVGRVACRDEVIEFLAARSGGRRAVVAERAGAGAGHRRAHRRARDAGRRRGRDAAQGAALRQGRRPALRLHLGLDQVHARVGPRRVAVLPGGDARRRRGPALHRAPDGRSSPPRTSATRTRRRCRSRSPRAHAVEHVGLPECTFALAAGRDLPRRWRRSPTPPAVALGARPGAHPRARRADPARRAALRRLPGGADARPRRRLRLPARPSRHVNDQEHLPEGREHLRFYEPGDERARAARAPGRDPGCPRPRLTSPPPRQAHAAVVAAAGRGAGALHPPRGGGAARRARRARAAAGRRDGLAARAAAGVRAAARPRAGCARWPTTGRARWPTSA